MTTQTPASAEIEKWLRIRFATNFWLRVRKKNTEPGSMATSGRDIYITFFI